MIINVLLTIALVIFAASSIIYTIKLCKMAEQDMRCTESLDAQCTNSTYSGKKDLAVLANVSYTYEYRGVQYNVDNHYKPQFERFDNGAIFKDLPKSGEVFQIKINPEDPEERVDFERKYTVDYLGMDLAFCIIFVIGIIIHLTGI